jgi:hypothetical protein
MAMQIQLAEHQLADFRMIRDLGPARLESLAVALERLHSLPIKPADLRRMISDAVPGKSEIADSVTRQALAFCGLMRQVGVDDLADSLHNAIVRDGGWSAEELTKWEQVEPLFHRVAKTRAVRLVSKAIDLSYEYANVYQRGRIITDVRPLYNDDAMSIEGAVVSFTFRIRFDSVDGNHGLSIAMDEGDVLKLRDQCDRALRKAETALDVMVHRAGIVTTITGSQSDE